MKRRLWRAVLMVHLLGYIAFAQDRTVGVFNVAPGISEGYTLFSPSANNKAYLIDNCGQLVNSWEASAKPGNALYLMDDGSLYRAAKVQNMQIVAGGAGGIIEKYNWEGDLTWSYKYSTPNVRAHHDFQVLPNGNVLILAWEVKSRINCIQNGRNPELLSENELWPEKIIEVEPVGADGGTIVWEWNAWDHMVQDFDDSKGNFGVVADHPEKINVNYIRPGVDGADWQHANSIDYNAQLDQIMLSVLFFDEIWIIDHSTSTAEAAGPKGDLLFRWGNPKAYNNGGVEDQQLFGQHNAHWIAPGLPEAGKVMVFNNGVNRPDGVYSSVIKLDLNTSGDYPKDDLNRFLPNTYFWEHTASPKTNFYSRFISGAHQLPNGNTLITDGAHGTFFEINSDQEEVWRYVSPVTIFGIADQGNIVTNPAGDGTNTVFRATKYPANHPAFLGRDLTPGPPIENNPDLSPCEIELSTPHHNRSPSKIAMFPNPASDYVTIVNYQGAYSIVNVQGKTVINGTLTESGPIPTYTLVSGLYFVRFDNGTLKKLIIQ